MSYSIEVQTIFAAAHAIVIEGEAEPMHGHNWHVRATVEADTLDDDGLVCDFHAVELALKHAITPFAGRTMNDVPPFNARNPTAEHLAAHIAHEMQRTLTGVLPPSARLASVTVMEAPGCCATYRTSGAL